MTAVNWPLAGGVAAIFVALFIIAVTVLVSWARSGRERDLAGRIAHYGPRHGTSPANQHPDAARNASSVALDVTKRLMSPAAQQRLSGRLELAAVTRKPAEWVLLGVCVAVVIATAVSVVTGNVIIGVLVGALLGWLSMRMLLSYLIGRRRGAFAEQLPDLLQLIASSLQSGFSLPQALDTVMRETAQPAAG
jgi:Flp pilus assembly protein TadB